MMVSPSSLNTGTSLAVERFGVHRAAEMLRAASEELMLEGSLDPIV